MPEKFTIRVHDGYGWESHEVTGLWLKQHISRIWMEEGELHFSIPAGCCGWFRHDERGGIFVVDTREAFLNREVRVA